MSVCAYDRRLFGEKQDPAGRACASWLVQAWAFSHILNHGVETNLSQTACSGQPDHQFYIFSRWPRRLSRTQARPVQDLEGSGGHDAFGDLFPESLLPECDDSVVNAPVTVAEARRLGSLNRPTASMVLSPAPLARRARRRRDSNYRFKIRHLVDSRSFIPWHYPCWVCMALSRNE